MRSQPKWPIVVMLIVNLLGVAAVLVVASMQTGVAKLRVLSTYRDLQHARVIRIDEDALKAYGKEHDIDLSPSADWANIPEYLMKGYDGGAIAAVAAVVCLVNCAVAGWLLMRRSREAEPRAVGSGETSCRDSTDDRRE